MNTKSSLISGRNRPLIFGHRGVPEDYQENTMAGFQRAVELGLDGVELDVFLTLDGRLVVFHDMEVTRLTGAKGRVTEMTWDQLRELEIKRSIDVGDKTIDYGKTRKIALLEEVLEEVRNKLIPIIEIKSYNLDYSLRHTGVEVARLIHRMGLNAEVMVTSYNFWPLYYLKRTCSDIESGFTWSPDIIRKGSIRHHLMESSPINKLAGSTLANMCVNMFGENTVEQMHERGLVVGAWTIFSQDSKWLGVWLREEEEMAYIRNLTRHGIDYFITDDPVKLQRIIKGLCP